MLARLFIVLLLAISLSSARESTVLETASPLEMVFVDAEPPAQGGEVTVGRPLAAAHHPAIELVLVLPRISSVASSPDLGRVFRPPRLLGS